MKIQDVKLTDKQKKSLKKYENHLRTAYYSGYCTGLYQSQIIQIFDFYQEIFHTSAGNISCQHCVLNALSKLGNVYFNNNEKK